MNHEGMHQGLEIRIMIKRKKEKKKRLSYIGQIDHGL
jgi:hypothetical protein